jgi:peroxiredoxin
VTVLRSLLSLSIVLAALFGGAASTPAFAQKMPKPPIREGIREGELAYDFTLNDLDGKPVKLSALRGDRVVLVVFWATWCMPCLQEMPALMETYAEYRGQGLEILGVVVAMDQTKEGVQEFVTKRSVPYPVLWDENLKVMSRYRVDAIPQNFLIGRDGVIRYAGGVLPEGRDEMIRALLATAPAASAAALR